jgi:hypothetical protein
VVAASRHGIARPPHSGASSSDLYYELAFIPVVIIGRIPFVLLDVAREVITAQNRSVTPRPVCTPRSPRFSCLKYLESIEPRWFLT